MIDCHAHWIPEPLARLLAERDEPPCVSGETLITWLGRRPLRPLLDIRARLTAMDRNGVAMQLLSLGPLFGVDGLPAAESAPLARAFNDAAAELCTAYPDRFAALAALPVADVELAAAELRRAASFGLRGAALPADGFATRADARRFEALFAAADSLRSHLFIHPGPCTPQRERNVRHEQDSTWQRHIVLETQARLSECIVTLACSDVLDAFPQVTVQVANLGGAIPFLVERMDNVDGGDGRIQTRLRRCYVDTASFGPRAVALAVQTFGADRVVLGTDCPIFSVERMLDGLAGLPADIRRAITATNPARLLAQRGSR